MFVGMGLCAIFPVFHGVQVYGLAQMRNQIGLFWLVLQGVLYIVGAGIYAVSQLSDLLRKSLMGLDALSRIF